MVVGKMKDEYKEIPIIKFVGLKSKMNCILSDDGKEKRSKHCNRVKRIWRHFTQQKSNQTQNEKNLKWET